MRITRSSAPVIWSFCPLSAHYSLSGHYRKAGVRSLASKLEPLALSEGFEEGFIARTAADIENFCYYIGSCSNPASTQLFQRRHQAVSCHLGADRGPLMLDSQTEQPLVIEEPRRQGRSATKARRDKRAARKLRESTETLKEDEMGSVPQLPGPREQQNARDDLTCSSHGTREAIEPRQKHQLQLLSRKETATAESQQRQGKQQINAWQDKRKPGLPETESRPAVAGPCPKAAMGPMRAWGQLPHFWPQLPSQQLPTSTETAGTQYRGTGDYHLSIIVD